MLDSHPRRPLFFASIAFLLAAIAAAALIWRLDQHDRQQERARVFNLAGEQAGNLQRSIGHDLSATYALAALVRQGKGTVPNFDEVATQMLPFYPGVSELALAPGGIIRDVVPFAGNEKAVGHDLLGDPAQNKEAFLARDTGKLTLAGPLDLVRGRLGAVGRLPVFLDDAGGKPSFWGFTSVVIRFPEALETVDLPRLAQQGFAYELWRIHPDTGQKQVIAASSSAALIDPVGRTLQVANATWTLSVAPLAGWGDRRELALEAALGLLFSLMLAYLTKLLLELRAHREGLEALVGQRTAELRAREADLNHAQAIARIGSWALDPAARELRGSAEALRILGAGGSASISYQAFLSLVHPDDREAVDLAARRSLKGAPYDIQFRILAGAATRWVHSSAELTFDAAGRLTNALGTIQDVTERKQAEEALRESESRYRELFEANPQPMWVYDLETLIFLAVNDAAVAHYGYSRGEFGAMSILDIRPPEDVPRLLQRVAEVRKEDNRAAGIWRHRKKDGTLIDVEIASSVFDFGGRRAQIVLATDITERKRAQTALARRHDLYNLLSQTNQAIVRLGSRDELFPVICRTAVEHGRFRFAWIGMIDAADQRVRPVAQFGEDAGYVSEVRASAAAGEAIGRGPLGRALRAGARSVSNDFLDDPDSAPWHEAARRAGVGAVATFPIREREALVGAICLYAVEPGYFTEDLLSTLDEMALDVSFGLTVYAREAERKQAEMALHESEARFRSLTEMSSDFYWETDAAHRLTERDSANKTLSTISAFQRGAQIGERRWEIPYFSPDEAGWQAHRALLDAHLPFRNFELSRLGADGSERHISISGDPVFDASGAFKGYRGVGADITERKRHEEDLRRLNEELERRVEERTQALEVANRELEAFSYSVSHDLRAPLRAIHGFSRQVIDQYAGHIDEQGRDMLRRVSAGAEKMGHLIDDLLKLSRISRQAMQIQPVDLSALARDLAGELQAEAPERKVEWAIAPQVAAAGDPGLLRVALQNLLGNAWKYSSRRGLARIAFGVGEKHGRAAYFVRDNGAGFDTANAQKLFRAFHRLHSEAEFPGTGIGLATVARVIHRHGGEVWAEGRVDEGATFWFSMDRIGGGGGGGGEGSGSSSAAAATDANTPAGR